MIKYTIQEIIDRVPSFSLLEVTTSNEGFLFAPLQGIAPESSWLGGGFFKGLQKYMQNKNEGNENKIMVWVLNCTMDKIDRDGENKTQRLYRCCSNYALSKLIVDNGLEDLWRRENLDSPELYTKINHIMVSFTNHYNAISIDRLPSKTKIGKCSWYFNNSLVCKSEVSSGTKTFLFLLKHHTQKKQVQLQWTPAFKSGNCRLRFS